MSFNLKLYDAAEQYGLRSMSVTPAITQYNANIIGQESGSTYSWGNTQLLPGQSGVISIFFTGGITIKLGIYNVDGTNITLTSQTSEITATGQILSSESGSLSTSTSNIDAALQNENWYVGNDTISGNSYNNYLAGYSGNDRIDGSNGLDTSLLRGLSSQYIIQRNGTATVTNGPDGNDTHINIERLKFDNTNIALDVGPTQNAGSVYMIYKAAFNRAPDEGGMGYWLAQKDGGANIVANIAQGFVNSPEFIAKYGANPSNASYVDKLYQNVLGREGEAGGVAYWNQELNAGNISKAAVLVQFATLAEGAANVASLIANGIPYTEFVG